MRRTLLGLAFFLLLPFSIFADEPVNIDFSIQTFDASLFNEAIAVSACAESDTGTTTTVNALCAVQKVATDKGWPLSLTWYSFGAILDGLSTYTADFANNRFWLYFINGEPGSVALNAYHLSANDRLVLVYGIAPLRLSSSTTAISLGSLVSINAEAFDFNAWAWQSAGATDFYVNGALSTSSLSGGFEFSPSQAGHYSIVGKKTGYISSEPITIAVSNPSVPAQAAPTIAGGSCGACPQPPAVLVPKAQFDTDKALAFLIREQLPDGSFGSDLLNDWVALALGAKDSPAADILSLYLVGHPTESTTLTDVLRRAMALMALNLNPYMSDGNDYISRIKESFKDGQFGDATLINDDIFAVIVLRKAGLPETDSRLASAVRYIISKQDQKGGWQSPDLTAAALQAFSLMPAEPFVVEARTKALDYLKATLFDDGGYANAFTASWVVALPIIW
ncbi:MAG: DUF4430 domain-containing protein [Candidatus Taylorbacteria bacterium]|nr:DUF4430 domain-containing protein [Candidatus Taylorbacteria bacterium]